MRKTPGLALSYSLKKCYSKKCLNLFGNGYNELVVAGRPTIWHFRNSLRSTRIGRALVRSVWRKKMGERGKSVAGLW